ncbi:transmembrane sensor [Pseudomonas nitritireducens]|uniref:Transmembrane sensor n=1 Tax=Pseudomonas nitroreducens TaxID=46680 RepID=A0A7W7P039_PSENT|nr:FecR family protein [Pseudomonas nitritireducens]MBB4861862.1 transmembrane sensor [Pseudomonas nitritireducens]
MSDVQLDSAGEQAIDWMVRLRSGHADVRLQRQLQAWLNSDPAHADAWARLQRGLGAPYDNLRRMPGAADLLLHQQGSRRQLLRGLAGLGLLGGGLWLTASSAPVRDLLADLRTGTGERRNVTLEDGSRLSLNADSSVDLAFDSRQRLILLRHGELVIQVAPDAQRPLIVRSAQGEVRALGTRFLVSQEQNATRVVVLEHRVRVSLADQAEWRELGEGEAALLAADGIHPLREQTSRADWLDGRLSVTDEPLAAVIDALRPYLPGYVRVEPRARNLRVQGVFPLDDPRRTLAALGETLPLEVRRFGPWLTLISLREP